MRLDSSSPSICNSLHWAILTRYRAGWLLVAQPVLKPPQRVRF